MSADSSEACSSCGQPLAPSATTCEHCGAIYCPFCRAAMAEATCEHVLTVDSSGLWGGWPFEAFSLPRLAEAPRPDRDWSEAQKREAFGKTYPLLPAYGDALWRLPDPAALFALLRTRLSVEIVEATWDNSRIGEPGYLTLYFVEDPELAQIEMSTSMGRLTKGFQRLAAMEPSVPR